MSKRISSDVRKKVACTLITSLLVGSSFGLVSADNGFDDANYKNIGYISVVGEVGKHGNAGFISTGEGDAGGKSYGLSQFTSKGGGASANGFVKWLKKYYPAMGKNFDGVGKAGTASFDKAWKKTYEENKSDFGLAQMEYTGKNYVMPFVSKAKSEFGIDFSSTRALLELTYSTTVQFGVNGTLDVFKNAGINSNMTEIEILESATAEKIKSVGTYKFLGCNQNVRNSVKKRFSRELKEFKDIVSGEANIEGLGKITLDDLVNGNKNNSNSTLDDLVNGDNNNTSSNLDDLVNGDNNDTNSNLDDLVNGDNSDTNSNLDDLVNGDNSDTNSNLDDLVNGDNSDTSSNLDDLVNGDNNDTNSALDDLVNGDKTEDSTIEVPTEDKDNSDKESTLDDLVTENDAKEDNEDLNDNAQDTSSEEADNSLKEEQSLDKESTKEEHTEKESDAKEPVQNSTLDDLVNEDSLEESNKTEDNSLNETEEDTSDETSSNDKNDETKDSKHETENKALVETVNETSTALTLEEKLENNMFGKLFKMTKEIMENENGLDGVKTMYNLV